MNWLTRLLHGPKSHSYGTARLRARLHLEGLEDRLAPASVFVVPLSAATDSSHFHFLTDATSAAGAGGTVTIEPGTTPDTGAVTITQSSLTIQGDVPGNILASYDINVAASGVSLTNLHLGSVTIQRLVVQTTISKSLVANITENGAGPGDDFFSSRTNIIAQNVITGEVNLGGNSQSATNDQVANNTFASVAATMLQVTNSAGALVSSNRFFGQENEVSTLEQVAVAIVDSGTPTGFTTIANNTFKLHGPDATGIAAGQSTGTTAVAILNNAIDANFGLSLRMTTAANFQAFVQGNDFHGCGIGVFISGDRMTAPLSIDLGNGSLGSLGGNDFRSFRPSLPVATAAIVLNNAPATLAPTFSAQQNLFQAGIDPNTVIDDGLHNSNLGGSGNIDVSNPLSPARSFVQALYNEVLGRTGQIAELDPWVGLLNSQGPHAVAIGILRSSEALGRIVDAFYLRLLGRASDPSGRAGWISFLQSGNTEEQLETLFLTSPEYISHIDTDYVQSLYINILGRTGSAGELAAWYSNIQFLGLPGIANGFVTSPENRLNTVLGYFQTFLHRTPTDSEVAVVNSVTLDLLSLEGYVLADQVLSILISPPA
jgi:hypothetical protein